MTQPSDKAPPAADRPSPKKPYTTPRLETYGDLRKITNRLGNKGRNDGFFVFKTA